MRNLRLPLLTLLSFIFITNYAQTALDEVLVSASRIQSKKYESGKNITVISQKEIAQLPVNSVDELLQYVGGVNLNNRGGFGVQSDIGMRGSTFSQVLVLVDNQRINDPLTAHFNNYVPIPLSEVHHIEIVRGSASASFGADAVGGIIHIKTKTYEGLFNNQEISSTNGNVGIGDHNLSMLDAGVHQQSKRFSFSAAVKSSESDGEQLVNPNFANAQRGDSLHYNFFDLKTYTAAVTYRGDKLKFYARGGSDYREFAAKHFYTTSTYDESIEKVSSYWTQTALIFDQENSRTELNASYRNGKDSFAFNPLFTPNEHTTQRINATLSQNRKMGGVDVSFGIQTDYQDIVSTDRGDHQTNSNAAFILAQKRINQLHLNGGIRIENSEKIGTQLVPQLNASYKMDNLVLRSSLGRSIRQADFTERFTSYKLSNLTPGRNVGNPDLEAESSYNFDLGADVYLSENLQFSNTLFFRQSSNLIDYTLTNSDAISNLTNLQPNSDYLYAKNISESTTWGNEFGLKYTQNIQNGQIAASLNYTYLNTSTPDSVVSKYIANHPIHNLNGSLNIRYAGLGLNIGGALITRNAEAVEVINAEIKDQYAILNLKLSYTIKEFPASVYMDVRNALDTRYQEILGSQMPGRWIMGGIRWNFQRIKINPTIVPIF
ncbi:MAG: TonB-dependent receptor [Bacteroidetes bacterium]|nr:TonB-dependent receptor [Bacteroidota bacterium]